MPIVSQMLSRNKFSSIKTDQWQKYIKACV